MGNNQTVSKVGAQKRYIEIISSADPECSAMDITRSKFQSSSKRLTKLFCKPPHLLEKDPSKENVSLQPAGLTGTILSASADIKGFQSGRVIPQSAGEIIIEKRVLQPKTELNRAKTDDFFIKPIGFVLPPAFSTKEPDGSEGRGAGKDAALKGPEGEAPKSIGSLKVVNLTSSKHTPRNSNKKPSRLNPPRLTSSHKKVAKKLRKFKNGATYEGDWDGNLKRHGFGTYVWADGAKYTGQWINNKAEGHGRYESSEGEVYEGAWKDDRANGIGTFTSKLGSIYSGEWLNDLQHGKGTESWPDGLKYEGQFSEGNKHGVGRQSFPDGSVYEGSFRHNVIEGPGLYTSPNGKVYEGEWLSNKMEGFGTIRWVNGKVFKGTFREGRREGPGESMLATGEVIKGIWEQGRLSVSGVDKVVDDSEGQHESAEIPLIPDLKADAEVEPIPLPDQQAQDPEHNDPDRETKQASQSGPLDAAEPQLEAAPIASA